MKVFQNFINMDHHNRDKIPHQKETPYSIQYKNQVKKKSKFMIVLKPLWIEKPHTLLMKIKEFIQKLKKKNLM